MCLDIIYSITTNKVAWDPINNISFHCIDKKHGECLKQINTKYSVTVTCEELGLEKYKIINLELLEITKHILITS